MHFAISEKSNNAKSHYSFKVCLENWIRSFRYLLTTIFRHMALVCILQLRHEYHSNSCLHSRVHFLSQLCSYQCFGWSINHQMQISRDKRTTYSLSYRKKWWTEKDLKFSLVSKAIFDIIMTLFVWISEARSYLHYWQLDWCPHLCCYYHSIAAVMPSSFHQVSQSE